MKLHVITAVAVALSLSACASIKSITPEQATNLVNAFAAAGCKGSVGISFGGAAGQLGGGVHAENTLNGQCDPANAVKTKDAAPAGGPDH